MLLLHQRRVLPACRVAEVDLQELVAGWACDRRHIGDREAKEPTSTRRGATRGARGLKFWGRGEIRVPLDLDDIWLEACERRLEQRAVEAVDVDLQQDGLPRASLALEQVDDVGRGERGADHLAYVGLWQVSAEAGMFHCVGYEARIASPVQLVTGILRLAVSAAEIDHVLARVVRAGRDCVDDIGRRAPWRQCVAPPASRLRFLVTAETFQEIDQSAPGVLVERVLLERLRELLDSFVAAPEVLVERRPLDAEWAGGHHSIERPEEVESLLMAA